MRTLDIFRTSVAGAALGFAQRALDESIAQAAVAPHVRGRRLADLQLTQAALADMATEVTRPACSRIGPRGCATKESESQRGGHGKNDGDRNRTAGRWIAPCKCSAPAGSCSAKWSSGCTGMYEPCGFTRVRPRFRKLIIARELLAQTESA